MVNEQLSGMLSGLRSSTDSSMAAFAKMEEKVMALEAEAEGAAMVRAVRANAVRMTLSPKSSLQAAGDWCKQGVADRFCLLCRCFQPAMLWRADLQCWRAARAASMMSCSS